MPFLVPSRPKAAALTLALVTGLSSLTVLAVAPTAATAADDTLRPATATTGQKLLTAQFDAADHTVRRGEAFPVSGTIRTVTQSATVGEAGAGIASRFTLEVTDATGAVLGRQAVTTAEDGSFDTTVPARVTRGLAGEDEARTVAVRAVGAEADGGYAAEDAGAGSVVVAAAATGLGIENSFVSSVGWVKPGDSYPSRVIVTNPGTLPVTGASVTVTAPTGTAFESSSPSGGTRTMTPTQITWTLPSVPAADAATGKPGQVSLVIDSRARTTAQLATIVWRDLSSRAVLTQPGTAGSTAVSRGPKVIPPSDTYDTARYGDRPFPIIPVQYTDRSYDAAHSGEQLETVIDDPSFEGSTFNLYQEMSLGQLFPDGTVPSAGIASAGFDYAPGFDFTKRAIPGNTCLGLTLADSPIPTQGTPLYPARITNGVYNLPGTTGYYGSDSNGSAVIGSLTGLAALQDIDSGCGPTGKLVRDAAAISDPEIDYSDYDTDKDGVVDFFMVVFAGCGGNGASQGLGGTPGDCGAPYDNVWPHSSSLAGAYTDPVTGLPGFTTDDQLKDLEGHPLWYTDTTYTDTTRTDMGDALKDYVRIGPYNVNPETAIDKASVISHEYGHSLGLPDFYSTGGRETYGDWNLMATDKSQNMDAFSRQELGWVVPDVLEPGSTTTVGDFPDSKQDTGTIHWRTPAGAPYTLTDGTDGTVHNSRMYVAKLPGRTLLDDAAFASGDTATPSHLWWSGSGNDFGCPPTGGRNFDLSVPGLKNLPAGTPVKLTFKSDWDMEWDFDYGYVLTTTDGGSTYTSHPSENGYTTSNASLPGNPNSAACQATYDNGITGTSGSYSAGTELTDRLLGNTPPGVFLQDSYDVSDLAGTDGAIRFSYATDPGLARPGWFLDDVKVTATVDGVDKVLYSSDFETSGGPDDTSVFNGGCREGLSTASSCTKGWRYLQAGAASEQDHAYYLEMRDRSGFDDEGHGQVDRDPIGFQAGLYLAYTDEAHGYGNAGTDDPPAQSPLDSVPEPGSATPDLNDAAFTAAPARSSYTETTASPHVDNYSDPTSASGNWEFAYNCLGFQVNSMSGDGVGPETSDGDLTGNVTFTMGSGCGTFDYGYTPVSSPTDTAPTAKAKATPATVATGTVVKLSSAGTTDAETPSDLDYTWDFDNGGSTKDATGPTASVTYAAAGTHTVKLLVTDPQGLTDTATVKVMVKDGRPLAHFKVRPKSPFAGKSATLDGSASRGTGLRYSWNFGNGGRTKDASTRVAHVRFAQPGYHTVSLTVTDKAGRSSTAKRRVLVRRSVGCASPKVTRSGSWRSVRSAAAPGGDYCDNLGSGKGKDTLTYRFRGPQINIVHGTARRGGTAKVYVDGRLERTISFRGTASAPAFRHTFVRGLGSGTHTVKVVVVRGAAYVDSFISIA